jgi:hypothetical protein
VFLSRLDGSSSPPAREQRLFESLSIDGWPLLLLLSGIAGSGLFAWGVRGHFVGDKTPGAMQVVVALSSVGVAVFLFDLWETSVTDWRAAAGFCLHLLAIALFGWAVLATRRNRPAMAFAGDRPDHVFRSGPYATIRHPFIRPICSFGSDAQSRLRRLFFSSYSCLWRSFTRSRRSARSAISCALP